MKMVCIEIELLADLIFTRDSATEGGHSSLDYIPGSAILGALLGQLARFKVNIPDILLQGQLRAENGYPMMGSERAYPVPLSYHLPKTGGTLINGLDPAQKDALGSTKQLRSGFLAGGSLLRTSKDYRMKTARNREKFGASAEGMLFGFESLKAGQRFLARLEGDTELLAQCLPDEGSKTFRLGRSRSAEYATVAIRKVKDIVRQFEQATTENGQTVLYCESDLCLVTEDDTPTLDPEAGLQALLGDGAKYLPEASYLRTRQYWPWNHFYNSPDRGHSVICAGSVLVFNHTQIDTETLTAGLFQYEGLGRLLVNPAFVLKPKAELSDAPHDATKSYPGNPAGPNEPTSEPSSPLIQFLKHRSAEAANEEAAIKHGKQWAKEWSGVIRQLKQQKSPWPGRSQWSQLRSLAVSDSRQPFEKLKKSLEERFYDGTRRISWGDKTDGKSIGQRVISTIAESKLQDSVRNRALYHASVLVYRKLANRNQTEPR